MLICEISQNFRNLTEAKRLIRLAKENGGDLVKAQLFDSMKLYGKHTSSELSFDQAKMLFDYGAEIGIEVFFSVFDVEKIQWCEEIGVKRYKIASVHQDWDVIKAVSRTGKAWIMSNDFFQNVGLAKNEQGQPSQLYCPPGYPQNITRIFGVVDFSVWDGFSDHTIGLEAAKIALARGAQILEKHFAVDHLTGIDAAWSMTPVELKELKGWETICRGVE